MPFFSYHFIDPFIFPFIHKPLNSKMMILAAFRRMGAKNP